MYKDKDKQRAAARDRVRRYRQAKKGVTEGVTEGVTTQGVTQGVTQGIPEGIPVVVTSEGWESFRILPNPSGPPGTEGVKKEMPANYGQPDCTCRHCQQNPELPTGARKIIINHGAWKPAEQLAVGEVNRVSLPGDVDYVPEALEPGNWPWQWAKDCLAFSHGLVGP